MPDSEDGADEDDDEEGAAVEKLGLPETLNILAWKSYGHKTGFSLADDDGKSLESVNFGLESDKVSEWVQRNIPKFVLIQDYNFSGTQVELTDLKARLDQVGKNNRHQLSPEDQTILIVLDLAEIDIDDFVQKRRVGGGANNSTIR